MECPFGNFLAWVFSGPIQQGGDTGCEQDRRFLERLARNVDHFTDTGDVRFE